MIFDQTTQHQRIHQRIISCENIDILIGEEAQMVTVEAQLVSEGTLSRYQRSTNRRIQGRLFTAWEEYMRTEPKNLREARRLLARCSGIYHPC